MLRQLKYELIGLDIEVFEIEIRGWRHIREIVKFVKLLKGRPIHIVHSHLYFASRFCNPIAKLSGIPVVIETAHMKKTGDMVGKKWLVLQDFFSSLFADKIIAVSRAVKKYFIREKRVMSEKIVVVHNGIDFNQFNASKNMSSFNRIRKYYNIDKESKLVVVVAHDYILKRATGISLKQFQKLFPNSLIANFFSPVTENCMIYF